MSSSRKEHTIKKNWYKHFAGEKVKLTGNYITSIGKKGENGFECSMKTLFIQKYPEKKVENGRKKEEL